MKVLLIYPYLSASIEICPPYGVSCLAAYLNANVENIDITVLDLNVQKKELTEKYYNTFDIVAFSFTTPCSLWVYDETKRLKQLLQDRILVVHGGVHPTIFNQRSLESGADIVISGEGEITFTNLLNTLNGSIVGFRKKISGIYGISYYDQHGNYVKEPDQEFIQNLDDVPFPDWSMFDLSKYNHNLHSVKGFALPIMASRGCLFACGFCCSPFIWKRKLRFRSVDNVVEEIKYNIKKFGIYKYHFYDDDFLVNKEYAMELLNRLIEEKLNIQYVIMARSDSINRNKEILPLLKKSGCVMIEFGIESIDETILKKMNKSVHFSGIQETIDLLNHYEITIFPLILFAYPDETLKVIYHTNTYLNKLLEINDLVYGAYLTPFPGTLAGKQAETEGIIIVKDWSEYIPNDVVFIPNSILNEIPEYVNPLDNSDLEYLAVQYLDGIRKYTYEGMKKNILYLVSLIDGKTSIGEIIKQYAQQSEDENRITYAFCYRYINYLAQLGFITEVGQKRLLQQWYLEKKKFIKLEE